MVGEHIVAFVALLPIMLLGLRLGRAHTGPHLARDARARDHGVLLAPIGASLKLCEIFDR